VLRCYPLHGRAWDNAHTYSATVLVLYLGSK